MDIFLLNVYIFLILISLVWIGHSKILCVLILIWMFSFTCVTIRLRRKGTFSRKRLLIYAVYDFPALFASVAAMRAKLLGVNNEWANGLLEIWVHPFFPVLELIPSKEIWGMSSAFLISCSMPIIMMIIYLGIYITVQPR